MDDPKTPCRPSWCLDRARAFVSEHFPWWMGAALVEEQLANLLDEAYLRGRREERSLRAEQGGAGASSAAPSTPIGQDTPEAPAPRTAELRKTAVEHYRARLEEAGVELDALRHELEALKDPLVRLMSRLRVVESGEDPESPITAIQGRVTWSLWHQLRNLYEATLPPADHGWLDRLEEEDGG